jgi:hypothetical protein
VEGIEVDRRPARERRQRGEQPPLLAVLDDRGIDPEPGRPALPVGAGLEIPTLGRPGLLVLLLAITLGALVILRRRG